MNIKQLLFFLVVLLFVGCTNTDYSKMGEIQRIGLETFSVVLTKETDSATVKTIEPSWSIYSVIMGDGTGMEEIVNSRYINNDNSNIVSVLRDTMVYEWLTLIKNTPTELKIIVEENPLDAIRSATVRLTGGVGYFGEELLVTQKGKQ